MLHLAAFEGSLDTVLLLLAAGASVNAQDLDGWTPLHYAARNELHAEALVRTLVAAGARIDKSDNRGRTGETKFWGSKREGETAQWNILRVCQYNLAAYRTYCTPNCKRPFVCLYLQLFLRGNNIAQAI